MGDTKLSQGGMLWWFLLAAAACLASGDALATCPTVPMTPGVIPCYAVVQPIDVNTTPGVDDAPFNNVSATVGYPTGSTSSQTPPNLPAAGYPLQKLGVIPPNTAAAPTPLVTTPIPTNSISSNPIGFVVQPASGTSPGTPSNPGVDVTRELLNRLGVELVWLPMARKTAPSTTLQVDLGPTPGSSTASCTGFIAGTTLNVSSCSTGSQPLAVYNFLSWTGSSTPSTTYITALGTGSGGTGTYTVFDPTNPSLAVGGSGRKQVTITAVPFTLTSQDFKTLSQQDTTVTTPKAISQGGTPVSPLGGGALTGTLAPSFAVPDPTIVNLFFVQKLNPPAALGGTLYGLGWLCNNGVAIAASTFQPARPDTIVHELMHNLCLDHGKYGAGPFTAATNPDGSYSAPFGIVPQTPGTLLPGQCDGYSACHNNLMTTGSLRTEPGLACILAGFPDGTGMIPPGCMPPLNGLTTQSPGLFNGTADQVTSSQLTQTANGMTVTVLPTPQLAQVLGQSGSLGKSGLLFDNVSQPLNYSGLLRPIPQETTKAQLDTHDSAGRVVFDLFGDPAADKSGGTLVAWILTLPQEHTFGHSRFDVRSQSRHGLVQDVKYYPNPGNNPLKRNIAYQPDGDNNADDPSIAAGGSSPCAYATAECLVVKFQAPGLEAQDSLSFSNSILSGDAPIANEDLCKAKITYIFSDGFVTTSNFGRCSPVSLPLIASSWHPDPYVAPHLVKSNVLLVGGGSPPCTPVDSAGDCPGLDIRDHDVTQESGNQPPLNCDNGASTPPLGSADNPVTGTIPGPNLILQVGQTCHYQNCEFKGGLTINNANATVYLKNCQVDGNLTMTSGKLFLSPLDNNSNATSVTLLGNVQIGSNDNLPNSFSIGPGTTSGHNLTIQNLPAGGLGYVCGSTFAGGVTVNNNLSLIQVGQGNGLQTCPINNISGGFSCKNNSPAVTGGGNSVSGGISGCPQ